MKEEKYKWVRLSGYNDCDNRPLIEIGVGCYYPFEMARAMYLELGELLQQYKW
jgi:hypothetical protein